MSYLNYVFGSSWGQRIVVLLTLAVYSYLTFARPELARRSFLQGGRTFLRLMVLIFAALLLASAVQNLLTPELISSWLGSGQNKKGVFFAGLLGGMLPGGPYAVYPLIRSVQKSGAGLAVVISMLIGYGAIGLGRVAFGLIFFEPQIVGLRVLCALPMPFLAGFAVYFFL